MLTNEWPPVYEWPTLEQSILLHLEMAVGGDGTFSDTVPISGACAESVRRGLAEDTGKPKFRGIGLYRITDAGRAFVAKKVPPAEW